MTLVFTDIEASTRLVQKLGEVAYGAALVQHRQVLRAAVTEHGGREVDCRADELFAVFDGANGGVAAAIAIQRGLDAWEWPGGAPVRVRIGVNTGEPSLTDGVYLGLDVNRAARICSAGHGGQVLVSQTTQALVSGEVQCRDLGEYILAGFATPERIFQVATPGLRSDFPPLRVTPAKRERRGWRGLRRQQESQPTLADAAWQARMLLPRVPEDTRLAVGELGASLFTAQRAVERADNFLRRVDHPQLTRRLEAQREMAVFSARAAHEAAAIQAEVRAVEDVIERRRPLTHSGVEVSTLLSTPTSVTAAVLDATRRRIADQTTALDDAVTHAAGLLSPRCFTLDRTRHRGVYQTGGRYIVPFIDDLGADREREFETLAEARNFKAALAIVAEARTARLPGWSGEAGGSP